MAEFVIIYLTLRIDSFKAIALVQTSALAQKIILEPIVELQYANRVAPMEVGVSRPILANARQVIAATVAACLYATRDFLFLFVICQSG